jgi:tRNA threonylcarbamoyl adenosine modification protein YeaZ
VVILALDTTTRAGSYAIWRDGIVIGERVGEAARTHAERLPGDLAHLLRTHGLTVRDVDVYAVASGPGSFTGLRVGIATIQGLALVHGRKVVPVSALEALAQQGASGTSAIVGAWMEAYRGEVFGALYRSTPQEGTFESSGGEGFERSEAGTWALVALEEIAAPTVANPATLAREWARIRPRDNPIVIGDAVPATRAILETTFPGARLLDALPLAGTIARMTAAQPHRAVLPHAIVPLYVRRPDAELARDRTGRVRDTEPAVSASRPPHSEPE